MDYSEAIIKEYDEMADRRVATVCRINITFMVIVGLLNILGIFIIDMKMNLCYLNKKEHRCICDFATTQWRHKHERYHYILLMV